MCACVKTSVEDDNFLREAVGICEPNDFYLIWEFYVDRESIIPGKFGFAVSVCRLRERGRMSV